MVVLEGASLGGGGTFAERRVTKIEQVQSRGKKVQILVILRERNN